MNTVELVLSADQKSIFSLLRQSFLIGAAQVNGIGEYRAAIRLLDKMDEVSYPLTHKYKTEEGEEKEIPLKFESGDDIRDLLDEGGTIAMTEQEFNLLKRCFDSATEKGAWRVQVAKDVVKTADLLDSLSPAKAE